MFLLLLIGMFVFAGVIFAMRYHPKELAIQQYQPISIGH
jgi:hypothetical protein